MKEWDCDCDTDLL